MCIFSFLPFSLFFLILIAFPSCSAKAANSYGDVVVDTVYRVYDGDTFYAGIYAWPPVIGDHIGIRVAGIDAPEIRDKRSRIKNLAHQARVLADSALTNAQKVELRVIRRDKYFRILADVYCDGHSLADLLIAAGLARPYYGGKKILW